MMLDEPELIYYFVLIHTHLFYVKMRRIYNLKTWDMLVVGSCVYHVEGTV